MRDSFSHAVLWHGFFVSLRKNVRKIGQTYNRKEKMLKLREKLISAEMGWLNGNKGYTVDEVATMMREAVKEAASRGKAE